MFKLAMSVLLTPQAGHEGGELELMVGSYTLAPVAPWRVRRLSLPFAAALAYCSRVTVVHQIRPVTAGRRVVLVARLGGPPFR